MDPYICFFLAKVVCQCRPCMLRLDMSRENSSLAIVMFCDQILVLRYVLNDSIFWSFVDNSGFHGSSPWMESFFYGFIYHVSFFGPLSWLAPFLWMSPVSGELWDLVGSKPIGSRNVTDRYKVLFPGSIKIFGVCLFSPDVVRKGVVNRVYL